MTELRLLVIDPDAESRAALLAILSGAGFAVTTVAGLDEARRFLEVGLPQLVLLDWRPEQGSDGNDWIRSVKAEPGQRDIPVIILSARSGADDKLAGFEAGADDYITKPYSARELVMRIKAILRRLGKLAGRGVRELAGIVLDSEGHRVTIGEREVQLTPSEYRLLEFFMSHPDTVFSRRQLRDQVWGDRAALEDRTVDVHILRLRKVLAAHGLKAKVQTVRGFGYRFSDRD